MKAAELRNQRADLIAQARQITNKAESEKRDMTAEENQEFDQRMKDAGDLVAKIEAAERRESLETAEAELRQSSGRRTGPEHRNEGPADAHANKEALRAWCLHGTRFARSDADTQVRAARCGITLGTPELSVRALSVGTTTAGGHTVPTGFAAELEKAMKFFAPIRGLVGQFATDSGNDLDYPKVDDTANAGSIVAEAGAIGSSTDPTFGKVTFKSWMYASPIVKVSLQLLQDSAVDVEALLGEILGERNARAQATHFVTGDGTTQPQGLATGAAAGVTIANLAALTFDKVIDLIFSVDLAYRNSGAFVFHDGTVGAIAKLKDTTGQYLWRPSREDGVPDRILNYPVVTSNDLVDATGTLASGNVVGLFGDMKRYKIRDITGATTLTRLVELYAATGQVGFVLLQRADGRYVGHSGCVKKLAVA